MFELAFAAWLCWCLSSGSRMWGISQYVPSETLTFLQMSYSLVDVSPVGHYEVTLQILLGLVVLDLNVHLISR